MSAVSESILSYIPQSSIVQDRNASLIIAVLIVLYSLRHIIFRTNLKDKDGNSLPPGPLLRYAFLRKYPERPIHAWAKKFGPLYSIWMGSQLFVVINDPIVARDLLVVNGANFSSRWGYFMKNIIILAGGGITAARYNDSWRKQRRIAMWALTTKSIQSYAPVIDYEAHMFVRSIWRATQNGKLSVNPARFAGRFALNNMLTITFGTRIDDAGDPLVERALHLGDEFMKLTGPWSNMIDFIKPLQWIPTRMRSRGRKLRQDFIDVYGTMIMRLKNRTDAGEDIPDCLVKTLVECQEKEDLNWPDMCLLATAFTTGGVHSTSGVIKWFLAFMPSHPEIQARAHEELDRVIGRDRWPSADDEMKLPYIRAIIKEVLRVHSPFWMATPHCSDNDFTYKGMFIPRDTVIILNCYSLHHNEARYPDPWKFNPDRYLGDNLSSTESAKLGDVMSRDHWAFGAGRRICPGMVIAERELWVAISRLLWTFKISADEPICLEEYEGNSGRTPLPFKIKLSPRHEKVQGILDLEEEIKL